jgi:hypothetical protein
MEALHCSRSALPSILLPLQLGRADPRGAVSDSRGHQSTGQDRDAPIDAVADRAAGLAYQRSRPAPQSGSACQGGAELDPDRPSVMEDRTVQVMTSSRSSSASSRISASG